MAAPSLREFEDLGLGATPALMEAPEEGADLN